MLFAVDLYLNLCRRGQFDVAGFKLVLVHWVRSFDFTCPPNSMIRFMLSCRVWSMRALSLDQGSSRSHRRRS
jgi:hypothetical protein